MMDRVSVRADSLKQGRYEASYRTSLPPEESFSQITEIPFAEVRASELQDISAIHHDLQVAFTYAEASSFTSISRGITEHASFDLAHSHPHTKQKIAQGHQVMTVVTTEHPYIVRDARIGGGEPIIVGTAVRVRILVEYWRAGTPPEELLQAFPRLTLAQVFDALSYYQDHQPEINALIEQNRVDPALLHNSDLCAR
jgi:uncharacterized protein (DUF433 family)